MWVRIPPLRIINVAELENASDATYQTFRYKKSVLAPDYFIEDKIIGPDF
jgi:hypothetical protein